MAITITISDLRKLIKERAEELRLRKFIRKQIKSVLTEQMGMGDTDEVLVTSALAGDMRDADKLVQKYTPLVNSVANRVARQLGVSYFEDIEDLKSDAMEHFLTGLRNWDPEKSPLGAFLRMHIAGNLKRRGEKKQMGLSGSSRKARAIRVGKASAERRLRRELGREPEPQEVADLLNSVYPPTKRDGPITAQDITVDLYKYFPQGMSANAPMGSEEDGSEMIYNIVQPLHPPQDVMAMQRQVSSALDDFKDTLPENEAIIFDVIMGDVRGVDAAEMLGTSRQTVNNKVKKLLPEIQKFLKDYGFGASSLDIFDLPSEAELMSGM